MRHRVARIVPFVIAAALAAQAASADPVRPITSGQITGVGSSFDTATFVFVGDGFSLTGRATEGTTFGCFPCAAGEVVMPGFVISGGRISGTIDGLSFDNLRLGGFFAASGPVTIPTTGGAHTLTFPFVVAPGSNLTGFADSSSPDTFRILLAGSGTGTLALNETPNPGGGTIFSNAAPLAFEFGGAANPSPVPEPASLLLLGTAVGGVLACLRRRQIVNAGETGVK